jgi:hypothetical protein
MTIDLSWVLQEVWRLFLVLIAAGQIAIVFAALIRADRALHRPGAVLLQELGIWPLVPSLSIGAAPLATWLAWSPGDLEELLWAAAILAASVGLTAIAIRALLRMLVLLPEGVVPAAPWRPAVRWEEVAYVKDGYYLLKATGRPLRIDRGVSWISRFATAALRHLPPRVFAGEEASARDLYEDASRAG